MGFSSAHAPASATRHISDPEPGQRVELGGYNMEPEAEPPGSARCREGWAEQSCRVLNRKGKSPFPLLEGGTRPQAPSWAPGHRGWVPFCCSPGRVPCRMRAASPRGWPCPPSWGQRAGGTEGTGGMVPAGMAGGTPHRTCRGRGHGPEVTGQMLQHTHGNSPLLSTVCFWRVFPSPSPTGWMGTI